MTPTHIPLCDIVSLSPLNVRGEAEAGDVASLAASIAAVDLIQPIVVRDDGRGWEVLEGGRRFAALRLLRDQGRVAPDHPVLVVVDTSDANLARERSLAANVIRAPLHPIEEIVAYARLVKDGFRPERIAADFNVPLRYVRQRLALNKLSSRVRKAWRAGQFAIEVAEALTLAPDAAAQDALLHAYPADHYIWRDPREIRRLLTAETMRADSAEAIYVGLDAYVAVGGRLDESLFEDFSFCSDGALLRRLAREKMLAEGEALMERYGYGYVALASEVENPWSWTKLPSDWTEQEAERLAELRASEAANGISPTAADEIATEIATLHHRAAQRGSTAAQRAAAWILLRLTNEGRLAADVGRLPPVGTTGARDDAESSTARRLEAEPATPAKAEPEPRKPGKALIETIDAARTAGFAQLVGERPDLAMILATAVLSAAFNESPLRVTVQDRNVKDGSHDSFAGVCTQLLGPANRHPQVLQKRFAAAVAAIIVVRSQSTSTTSNPAANPRDTLALAEIVAGFCGGETYPQAMRDHLNYEAYFQAATREAAIGAVVETGGDRFHAEKLKKPDLAAYAATWAKDRRWLPRELRPPEALPVDHPQATPIHSLADAMADALAADSAEAEAAWNTSAASDAERNFLPFSEAEREAIEEDLGEPEVYAVADFLTHECERVEGQRVKAADLFTAYQRKAGTRSREATSLQTFGEAVAAYGIAKRRLTAGVHYLDLRVAIADSQEAA